MTDDSFNVEGAASRLDEDGEPLGVFRRARNRLSRIDFTDVLVLIVVVVLLLYLTDELWLPHFSNIE